MQLPDSGPGSKRPIADFACGECRESTRFRKEPGTDFALVWQAGSVPTTVPVYDESLTGIRLVLADSEGFTEGTSVSLVYHGQSLRGVVRHVTPIDQQIVHVGIATQPMPTNH